ncbi:DUF975 family protein [Terribacillus saccharophilus]|uniref:DUF975 family protein n=1 Tax=Terribacillus saccharophilus TaxID=361277 RepID=UPI003982AA7A
MVRNSDLKRQALDGLSYKAGKAIGAGILLYVIIFLIIIVLSIFTILLAYPSDLLLSALDEEGFAGLIMVGIGYIICYTFFMPLFAGTSWMYLHLIRKEHTSVALMFTSFKYFPKLFAFGVIRLVLVALWSLLLIIPGILKYYSYSQTVYILRDEPDLSAMEAISESKRRMQGNRGKLFYLQLSFVGWYLLASITTFGLIFTYPYYKAARASFYEAYIKREDANDMEEQSRFS